MIVVDASVLSYVVGDDGTAGAVARDRLGADNELFAPDFVDVETVAVLRRRWLGNDLSDSRFAAAVEDLLAFPIKRVPVGPLMPRRSPCVPTSPPTMPATSRWPRRSIAFR